MKEARSAVGGGRQLKNGETRDKEEKRKARGRKVARGEGRNRGGTKQFCWFHAKPDILPSKSQRDSQKCKGLSKDAVPATKIPASYRARSLLSSKLEPINRM